MKKFTLVIHGGAGAIQKEIMTSEREKLYRKHLQEALAAGAQLLKEGKTALDAVEAAVRVMEDAPMFNAGRGAVFTHNGTNELDAAMMDGATLAAGTIAGVQRIKNPVTAARLVMEKSPHVMLIGSGAEEYAQVNGLEMVDPAYFHTKERWEQLERIVHTDTQQLDHSGEQGDHKYGTVGAVALDQHGNLAAATSTGGMTNKRFGRVGDSPIIGSGTYADNATCAVSCTGHGEYFIQYVAAYDIAALMRYKGLSLKEAADHVIMEKLKTAGGEGGVIAVDKDGNYAMPYNTSGMFRGFINHLDESGVFIFEE